MTDAYGGEKWKCPECGRCTETPCSRCDDCEEIFQRLANAAQRLANAASNTNEYRIVTIGDVFDKIPADKIDQFLAELGGMIKYHKRLQSCLSELARSELKVAFPDGFVWTDDGKYDLQFRLAPRATHE